MTTPSKIQLALDTADLDAAVQAARRASVDIVEVGTVLVLHRGLDAVRALKRAVPHTPLVADLRIARAGEMFASMAFEAGADRVTVVGEAGRSVVAAAARAAAYHGGQIEVELWEGWTESELSDLLVDEVRRVIAHRPGGVPARDDKSTRQNLRRLAGMSLQGREVTLAGGIGPGDLRYFTGLAFDVVAVGKAIANDPAPEKVTAQLRSELEEVQTRHANQV